MSSEAQKYWTKLSLRLARTANFGWWLQVFLPILVGINAVFCVLFLLFRRFEGNIANLWLFYILATVAAGVFSWRKARKRFYNQEAALVRLEDRLKLKGDLLSAREGRGEWPAPRAVSSLTFEVQPGPILRPLGLSILVLLLGLLIPTGQSKVANLADLPAQPQSWEQVEQWIEELRENELVDEAHLNQLEEKLAELQSNPVHEWYSPDNLEAGENLEKTVEQGIRSLSAGLSQSSNLVEEMAQAMERGDLQNATALREQLREQLEQLSSGTMPLNREMLEQLQSMTQDSSSLLTPEAMKQLAEKMRDQAATGGEMCGPGNIPGDQMASVTYGEGDGGDDGDGPGSGGIGEGPGNAPMLYNTNPDLVPVANVEAVSNPNMENVVMGDTLGVSRVEQPADDIEYSGTRGGARTDYSGQGGQATWRGNFTPEERNVLQDYFR